MNVARENHVAALLHNGSVLVAGGHPGNNIPTNTAEVYSPATGTWAAVGSMGTARRLFGACTLASGKVLVAGGNAGAGDVASSELFDPSANTWSATGSLAAAREDFSMTCLSDGRVLAAGGSGPSGLLSSAEVYDPTAGTWSSAGTMPAAVHTQGAVLLQDGRVLIAGGNNALGPVSTAAIWTPSTNAWSATGSMATPRAFYALNLLGDGRVLAAGGLVNALTASTNTTEIYTPSTGAWSAAAPLNTARYSGVSATLAAGPIVVGGVNGGPPLGSSESYDSVHNTWTQNVTAYGAVNQTATALTPTSVLVAGGNTGSSATTCAQIFGILNGFAIYAQRSVTLGSSDHINGGDIGVSSVAPSAFGPQLVVGSSTTVQTNHNLAAPSVSLGSGAHVGDVQTNTLTNAGATLGTQASYPSSMPSNPLALPAGPGGSNVTVPAFTITTLNPGDYGALSVTGTVNLNAGHYTFSSVTMAAQAHLAGVSGTAIVAVAGTFQAGNSVSISSPGATPAGQLVISVAGSDSGSTPAFSIGTGAAMSALLSAPYGTLSIGDSTIATGAFAAFDVKLGNGVTINFQNGFAPSQQIGQQPLTGYVTPQMAVAPLVGPVPPSTAMNLSISLPVQTPTDFPALSDFADQVSDPTNARYRQFLSPADYASHYQPSLDAYNAVKTFAQSFGMTIVTSYADRELVDVSGTAAQVQQMLNVNLNFYLRPDGTQFYGPDRDPSVNLSTPILYVDGTKNFDIHVPAFTGTGPSGRLWGRDFRNVYIPSCASQLDGSGQSISIIAFQGYNTSDIAAYVAATGLPGGNNISRFTFRAGGIDTSSAVNVNGSKEGPLDVENAIAMAPKADIIVFQSGSSESALGQDLQSDVLHAAAHPPDGSAPSLQVSASYNLFTQGDSQKDIDAMASQGQSFFTSSGDGGSFTGNVGDVRAMNHVTVVGGTTIASGAGFFEGGWGGSGGGFLGPYTYTTGRFTVTVPGVDIPLYQKPFANGTNQASGTYRNFPDVSMVATNIENFFTTSAGVTGQKTSTSGTSDSSPLWAGFMALANQQAKKNGVVAVGFANPTLYGIASTPALYASCFNDPQDLTQNPANPTQPGAFGTNSSAGAPPPGGFSTIAGYDLVTGLGSPTCSLIAQLGSPTPLIPVPPPSATPPTSAVFAGIGPNDTCGIISGATECWGTNVDGEEGNGTTNPQLTPGCSAEAGNPSFSAIQIVEGDRHSCALYAGGSTGGVFCWGDNSMGQLASNLTNPAVPSSSAGPVLAGGFSSVSTGVSASNYVTQISAGGDTTCAVLVDGSVWCGGSNNQGQLGTGSANSTANPVTQVPSLPPASQVAVSPGGAFVCALLKSGGVDCWGSGYLGDFNLDTNSQPVAVQGLSTATAIAVGTSHACAIVAQSIGSPSNVLYCWGDNSESEIGEGDVNTGAFPTHETIPVVATQVSGCVSGCPPPVNVTAVAAGGNYTCVVVSGGTVKCWGDNTFGQLGNGTATSTPNPQSVSGLSGVTQLAAGPGRVCALASGISCWGEGPVGDGSSGNQSSPKGVTFARCP